MIVVGVDVGLTADRSAVAVVTADPPGPMVARAVDDYRPGAEGAEGLASRVADLVDRLAGRPVPVWVAVDGVGVGGPVAERIRALVTASTVKVGTVLATGGRRGNWLDPGPVDFRRSCPASVLVEDLAAAVGNGRLRLPATLGGLAQLRADLAAITVGADGRASAERTTDGHADTASAMALACHLVDALDEPDAPADQWAQARAHQSAIERAARAAATGVYSDDPPL